MTTITSLICERPARDGETDEHGTPAVAAQHRVAIHDWASWIAPAEFLALIQMGACHFLDCEPADLTWWTETTAYP